MSENEGREGARLAQLLDVMLAIARQDFDVRAQTTEDDDVIDAIAVGLNMLVEELRGEVASRTELERAHDDLKRTQAQLVHAGKLAAIGQLSAGIAHEINNPIQGIQMCLSIVRRTHDQLLASLAAGEIDRGELVRRLQRSQASIDDADEAIERVRGVTQSLRTFARTDEERFSNVQLDEIVRVACRLSESTARARARLDLDLLPVPPVSGSRGRLGQVVTNLLVNAVQALPESDPSRHRILVTLRQLDRGVTLAIDDSGPGVPVGLRAQIFEPFFTTKPPDEGTGLGLSLASEIVLAHGGTIRIEDSPLGGARFLVWLPLTDAEPTPHRPRVADATTRRARVLFIDDEELLLRLYESALGDDCDVVTARSGDAALELLGTDAAFDLVVCDLQMPGKDGVAVYEALHEVAAPLVGKLVFATGGATTARGRAFLERTGLPLLHKPFLMSELLAFVKKDRR